MNGGYASESGKSPPMSPKEVSKSLKSPLRKLGPSKSCGKCGGPNERAFSAPGADDMTERGTSYPAAFKLDTMPSWEPGCEVSMMVGTTLYSCRFGKLFVCVLPLSDDADDVPESAGISLEGTTGCGPKNSCGIE